MKKLKKKITFVDILIILAVVLAAAFVFLKLSGTSGTTKKTVTYSVLVTGVMPEHAESMVPDDKVLLDAKNDAYGRVVDVVVSPAEDSFFNQKTEEYVKVTTDARKDVVLTIEAEATVNDWGYEIGQQNIRIGELQYVTATSYVATGYIIGVDD